MAVRTPRIITHKLAGFTPYRWRFSQHWGRVSAFFPSLFFRCYFGVFYVRKYADLLLKLW